MRYVRVGRVKSIQDSDGELIKVIRDIYKSKRVNVVFYILHIISNSLITLLRTGKILAMDYDWSTQRREAYVFSRVVHAARCGGGRDKLH